MKGQTSQGIGEVRIVHKCAILSIFIFIILRTVLVVQSKMAEEQRRKKAEYNKIARES